jgi:RNA methyltransferase, TrmH family
VPTGRGRREDPSRREPEVVRSAANPIVKLVRSLGRRAGRRQERAFVVEGVRAVGDAIAAGAAPTHLLLREGGPAPGDLPFSLARQTAFRILAPALFDELSDTVHPQGVLAVFPLPERPIPRPRAPLYLIVAGLRDPGNLGTLLRAAAGAGATAALLSRGTVDPFNPKVVRAAMGAHFRLPIHDLDAAAIELVRETAALRAVARVEGGPPHDALDWRQPAALIVASETGAEDDVAADLANVAVSIPMAPGVESLNAGVACAVVLFEAARQRRRGPRRGAAPRRSDAGVADDDSAEASEAL